VSWFFWDYFRGDKTVRQNRSLEQKELFQAHVRVAAESALNTRLRQWLLLWSRMQQPLE
jgi:hypothetical protein